jgi:Flp pilus assembly protein TadG
MNDLPVRLSTHRNFHPARKETGAVAVIVALSLVGLVGFVGLALDLGKLFVAKTELQNSADACALAAARELTGANTNQLELAEAAGKATGERHDVLFQDEQIVISSVTFSETLAGSYQAAFTNSGATAMRFARCEASKAGIANWFIQVLNLLPGTAIGDQTVAASAVATLAPSQITSCAIPVAVCSKDVPPTTPVGKWLDGVLENDKNITGSFKWVDFTPHDGGGAKEVGENLTGPGVCNLPATGAEVGESGYKASLAADWNSRFGIYFGDVKDGDVIKGIGIPDFSGYAYTDHAIWSSGAFADFQNRRAKNDPYQGDSLTGLKTKGSIKDYTYLKMHGIDRRLATIAVVDCDGFISGSTAPVTEWACILMLHPINNDASGSGIRMYLEYLGRSNQANSPCATNGVPAGPTGVGPMVPALVR